MAGTFITFEGTEGSGKTSVIREVKDHYESIGYAVLVTREPGGVRISEKIRDIILDRSHTEMDARTEALLFAASRRQHLKEVILPALQEGKIVLCDRYVDSSLVYQGIARGLGIEAVYEINRLDLEQKSFHQTIYDGYKDLIRRYPARVKSVPGERPIPVVVEDVLRLIDGVLPAKPKHGRV
jgi:dTMP kinase